MTDEPLSLAADFPASGREAWRELVETTLKGKPFETLVRRGADGIPVQPLYTAEDAPATAAAGTPGHFPFLRGPRPAAERGWRIGMLHTHPDPAETGRRVREDLANGAGAVWLRLDPRGEDGVLAMTAEDVATCIAAVDPEHVPVMLDAGSGYLPAAALLAAAWRTGGADPAGVRGSFNADPLGALAAEGRLPVSVDIALEQVAALGVHTAEAWPLVTAAGVSTAAHRAAGATDVQELAAALATGVAYLRALAGEGGLPIDVAARQIRFTLEVDADVFPAIAKLRAARKVWARVCQASGASGTGCAMRLHAVSGLRIYSQRDPWVNLLRATAAGFAAGVAGAETVTVLPFDAALGVPNAFSRRMARNLQVILQEESALARVADPAGGSWYVERLSEQMAAGAWELFQEIERRGGMARVLESGWWGERLATAWASRAADIARRRIPLTGVSEFPDVAEKPVRTEPVDRDALRLAARTRLAKSSGHGVSGTDIAALIAAAETGAGIDALTEAVAGEPATARALPAHRFAEEFETLRDACDAAEGRPTVFLANIGAIAQHTARATFAKNFFEAGGFAVQGSDGFASAANAAAAFKDSPARIAVVCGADDQYAEHAEPFVRALKTAGAARVYLAGKPGENEAALREAGLDGTVRLGSDVLATLRDALSHLGVI